jgi:Domain of unknown function (DUF1707)
MTAVPESHVVPFSKPQLPRVRLRASDTDRQATVQRLQDALARGQLTFDEAGERMATAWATRYLADLEPLTADLPPAAEAPSAPGWSALFQMALAQLRLSLARTFPGGLRSTRARVALAAAVFTVLVFVVLAGAAAHALFEGGFDGGGYGGEGFGGHGFGDWHGPNPQFGGG